MQNAGSNPHKIYVNITEVKFFVCFIILYYYPSTRVYRVLSSTITFLRQLSQDSAKRRQYQMLSFLISASTLSNHCFCRLASPPISRVKLS